MSVPDPAGQGPGRITVLAGVNGAGRSSILGTVLRRSGAEYFNPDEYARALRAGTPEVSGSERADPGLSAEDANARAWEIGRQGLARAIDVGADYAVETTLGGRTIADMLAQALERGREVEVHYVGLDAPERHVARVHARVARGGHDIPEAKIRERYTASRAHLVALLPRLTELFVYDNSAEADPATGRAPAPTLLLETAGGRIRFVRPADHIPAWAKPVAAAAALSDAHHHAHHHIEGPVEGPAPGLGRPPESPRGGVQPDL